MFYQNKYHLIMYNELIVCLLLLIHTKMCCNMFYFVYFTFCSILFNVYSFLFLFGGELTPPRLHNCNLTLFLFVNKQTNLTWWTTPMATVECQKFKGCPCLHNFCITMLMTINKCCMLVNSLHLLTPLEAWIGWCCGVVIPPTPPPPCQKHTTKWWNSYNYFLHKHE